MRIVVSSVALSTLASFIAAVLLAVAAALAAATQAFAGALACWYEGQVGASRRCTPAAHSGQSHQDRVPPPPAEAIRRAGGGGEALAGEATQESDPLAAKIVAGDPCPSGGAHTSGASCSGYSGDAREHGRSQVGGGSLASSGLPAPTTAAPRTEWFDISDADCTPDMWDFTAAAADHSLQSQGSGFTSAAEAGSECEPSGGDQVASEEATTGAVGEVASSTILFDQSRPREGAVFLARAQEATSGEDRCEAAWGETQAETCESDSAASSSSGQAAGHLVDGLPASQAEEEDLLQAAAAVAWGGEYAGQAASDDESVASSGWQVHTSRRQRRRARRQSLREAGIGDQRPDTSSRPRPSLLLSPLLGCSPPKEGGKGRGGGGRPTPARTSPRVPELCASHYEKSGEPGDIDTAAGALLLPRVIPAAAPAYRLTLLSPTEVQCSCGGLLHAPSATCVQCGWQWWGDYNAWMDLCEQRRRC